MRYRGIAEYLRGLRVKREKLPHRTARVSKRIRQSALASIPWGPWGAVEQYRRQARTACAALDSASFRKRRLAGPAGQSEYQLGARVCLAAPLANPDYHRVRADQMLDAGLAEAGFIHPALAVGAGIVESGGGFNEHVEKNGDEKNGDRRV